MTLAGFRGWLYTITRILGDAQAAYELLGLFAADEAA